MSCFWHTFR